ncbi:hypothetical protein D3C85_1870020 [compost metagenome]
MLFIQHNDAGRYAGAVKQVGRKADDALNKALLEQALANSAFGTATEQHTVGQNDRAFA